jgi:putative ABC transport system permease protein
MLKRSILRQIRGSLGRYLAILSIIALGVGFFAGLRVAKSAMLKTADEYLTELNLFDFRLVSTLGLTEDDVAAFAELDGIEGAYGSVSADLLYVTADGSDAALHAHTLLDGVNGVDLQAGRLPERDDECVVDANHFSEDVIGTQLVLSEDNPDDTLDNFTYDAYTIVGTVNSSYYVNFERGSTSLGRGTVSGFVYLLAGGFSTDYYTEIFLTIPPSGEIYTDEYEAAVDAAEPAISALLEERAQLRYDTLRGDAIAEIDDAQAELDDGWATYRTERADAEAELADAKQELDDARADLDDGWAALEDGKTELEQQRQDGAKQLDDAQAELDSAKEQLDAQEAPLSDASDLLTAGESLMQGLNAAMGTNYTEPSALMADLTAGENPMLNAAAEQALAASGQTTETLCAAWNAAETSLGAPLSAQTLAALQAKLDEGRAQYEAGVRELVQSRTEYEEKIAEAEQTLADSEQELNDGEAEYADGLADYEQAEADAEQEFADAEMELNDGQSEIDDAWEQVEDIKQPTTYTLDRTTNIGYACLENDTGIVEGVSRVFPLFFFLVAALVCVTTMTRMVDEQRTQNGVLKALGFGNGAIVSQYLAYAGSASIIGCVAGFLLGSWLMPVVLWKIYMIMYSIERPIVFVLDWGLFAVCTAMYLICALGATWLVCYRELTEAAAELIRPKSPKAGKRILIERVKFLWKRVPFLHKVSIRNIIRYKKRMIMMLLGIGGCTALLLTGFGIRDSIQNIVNFQYDEIELYDCAVTFHEDLTEAQRASFAEACGDDLADIAYLHAGSMDLSAGGQTQTVHWIVFDEPLDNFISLHDGDTALAWPAAGEAVINRRLANTCNLAVGDTIRLNDSDYNTITVTVSGIFDNYIYDYVYVSAETCQEQLGYVPSDDTAYAIAADGADVHTLSAAMLSDEHVAAVTVNEDMRDRVNSMLSSLDYVVLIVLVCAGALAFIVLYNLTNISITERIREIATLKVLGFYANESAAYVFRENMVLTGLSALVGLPMGILLHRYVMAQIKINSMYFECRIAPISYVYSVLLTFVFAVIVMFFLYFKLERINMAESLKSIE